MPEPSSLANSAAVRKIVTDPYFDFEPGKRRYLLMPEELWARYYAQFIAKRSGNPTMNRQLSTIVSGRSKYYYQHCQWTDEDFAPIETAIENPFRKLNWI